MAGTGTGSGMRWLWRRSRRELYDTHKVYLMLVKEGLDSDKAEFFVTRYVDLLKTGKAPENGNVKDLENEFLNHRYSQRQARDAVSLLQEMIPTAA